MKSMKSQVFLLLVLLLSVTHGNEHTKNSKVVRKIDIASQIVKIETIISSDNFGSTYLFAAEPGYEDNIAFIGASTKTGEDAPQLPVKPHSQEGKQGKLYKIELSGQRPSNLIVTAHYTHKLVPFPNEITQSERQFIKFTGNAHFYSPYASASVETHIKAANPNILDYTNLRPVNKQDASLTYGPYADTPAWSRKEIVVHFENNAPFLTVVDMLRHVELSHWGNIAIEEQIHMVHSGAKLKGSFSRYEYQRRNDGVSSVKAFKTVLPAAAKDVYYRDEIGNVSTSNLKELLDSVEIELRPRFPLFGGWNTKYTLGYNVPSYEYLYHSGNNFALRIRFVDHVHDDMVVDRVTIRVVLPEWASNIRYEAPYPVVEGPMENIKTYLDTVGRPVLVLSKTNLVDAHIQDMIIRYEFASWYLIREPLMVTLFFCIIFVTVIFGVRLNFSIVKDAGSEMKLRLNCLKDEVVALQDRRSALYQGYEDAINKFKPSKNQSKFKAEINKVSADHKNLTKKIADVIKTIRSDQSFAAGDLLDKLDDLQRQDGRLHEMITQSIAHAESLVSGKMSRQLYLDNDTKANAKKEEIIAKMEQLLDGM